MDSAVLAKFDPAQPRDLGGEDGGQWVKGPGAAVKDALKLAGKIRLDDGEEFHGSDKVSADMGTVRIARTVKHGKPLLRIGIGGEAFGSRDDEAGPWRAGPDDLHEANADARREQAEIAALEAENAEINKVRDPLVDRYVANLREGGPPLSAAEDAELDRLTDRWTAIEKRLGELEDSGVVEKFASGHTTRLSEAQARQLHDALDDAAKPAEALVKQIHALDGRGASQAEYDALPDDEIASGSIPGEWGDVHYRVEVIDAEARTTLWVVPPGMDSDDVEGAGQDASFDAAEVAKLLRTLSAGAPVQAAYAADDGGPPREYSREGSGTAKGGQFAPTNTASSKPAAKKAAPRRPGVKPAQKKPAAKPAKPKTLKRGADNDPEAVKQLQALLTELGVEKLTVDGVFGDATDAGVKAAQVKLGMKPTGRASPALLRRLHDAHKLSPCVPKAGSRVTAMAWPDWLDEDDDDMEPVLAGADVTPGHDNLHLHWTKGKGLPLWVDSPTPWTTLVGLLTKHVGAAKAKVFASRWFIEVFGYAAGSDKNRVAHGKPPRGNVVGPG